MRLHQGLALKQSARCLDRALGTQRLQTPSTTHLSVCTAIGHVGIMVTQMTARLLAVPKMEGLVAKFFFSFFFFDVFLIVRQ